MNVRNLIFTALLLAGALAIGLFASRPGPTAQAASGDSNVTNLVASGDVTAGDDITAGDDLSAGDDASVTDDLTVGGFLGLTPQTAIAVGYQGTITPTGGLQYLTASAARGTRLVVTTTLPAGTIIAFYNAGANTITLTDTAPLVLGGNAALGAKDTLVLFHNGTEWVQLDKTDN